MATLEKKIFIAAKMRLLTGLRVGDSKEKVEIGGVDAPVVRRKDNNEPYIPGSSLKGKIRCLLELMAGENGDSKCLNNGKLICRLFGAAENKNSNLNSWQSRLLVRDAFLTPEWAEKLRNSAYTDMPYTEIKWENSINRLTGTADAPRQFERIPAGAEFEVHFVINCFEGENHAEMVALLKNGLQVLADDYLGGSGTRGYGRVEFFDQTTAEKTRSQYLAGTEYATENS
jgi:CRISPR-associated protein Csm3